MKLTLCGDLSVTKYTLPAFENRDKEAAFSDVLELFADSDRVIVNLECALTESENRIKKCGPHLKGPGSTADTLKAAGVTDCLLSNNHIFDFGREGAHDTLRELERVGLNYTGYGKNYEDSRRDMVIDDGEVRVRIVDVCEHEYSYATENREGARPFDEFETMHDIRMAKADADVVIVIYHGGKEYCRYPSPRLMKACREMVRCGADAVFCQHSHCIGCFEEFEGGHILYGQGNFNFVEDLDDEMFNTGLVARIDASEKGIGVEYVPVRSTAAGIRLADENERSEILSALASRGEQLLDGSWLDGWREFCLSKEHTYRKTMAGCRTKKGYYAIDDGPDEYQAFAHYLDCEAHTDVWRELYKTYNSTNELD